MQNKYRCYKKYKDFFYINISSIHIDIFSCISVQILCYVTLYIYTMINISNYDYYNSKILLFLFYKKIWYFIF